MKRIISILTAAVMLFSGINALAKENTIITDNLVELTETVSDKGFIHPGVGYTAESLNLMRDMVKDGVSPWVDYFEGMRRTKYADLSGELKKQEQIVNNGGISSFAEDAQRAWVQAMLYFVTGNEEYRKIPVEAIKWYGDREDFFPEWFTDSHIKLGKYVNTFCEMAELMRSTTPKDESLAVTDEMIKKLDENCLKPMSDKCLSQKGYFMNQHSYALQGYIAETVLAEDKERYADAVEMATVNRGYTENEARNGSIENVFRMVTKDEETGEKCEPHLQLAEMGRDQDHAKGNIDNYTLITRTTDAQKTRVDPVLGTITDSADGVSVLNFLDDRIIKCGEQFFAYNMGYELPWTTIYSENNHNDKIALTVPDTRNEWRYVILDFSAGSVRDPDRGSILYLTAQSADGEDMTIDFDKINTSEDEIKPLEIKTTTTVDTFAAVVGQKIERPYASEDKSASYMADGLPKGAEIDKSSGTLTWTPDKAGDYEAYITADNGTAVYTKKAVIKVRDDIDGAIDAATEDYKEGTVYTTATKEAVEAAKAAAEADGTQETLDALQNAVIALEELNPQLKYGGLDYTKICTATVGTNIVNLADNLGSSITLSEPDMNFTLDFGNNFKIKADSFELLPPDGFPARILDMNVYGSDNGVDWTRLTENGAEISDKMQTLTVVADQKDKAYRYIRFYMPNGTNRKNQNAYICGVSEMRINGERIEEHTPDYHKGYMAGYEDGSYRPEENITRAEAASMLSRTLFNYMDNNECANAFDDVKEDAWYEKDIAYMAKKKYIVADTDKLFRPEDKITRGEFCDFVVRLKGLKGDAASVFTDTEGNKNEKNIALVAKEGWISGYPNGEFMPDANITRAEAASILCRIENRTDTGSENSYTDVPPAHWAFGYISEVSVSHYAE